MSAMLPLSMKSFITVLSLQSQSSVFSLHWVRELADTFYFHRHRVARRDRPDACRGAGRNDVARLEGHDERDEFDEVIDRKNQMGGAGGLAALAVHPALDRDRIAVHPGG